MPTQETTCSTKRAAFERLKSDYDKRDTSAKRGKFTLVLEDIHEEPEVFQHRDQCPEFQWGRDLHIANLVAAIKREPSRKLDPITVWLCGGRWIVLDGHYRLEAYSRYAREQEVSLQKFRATCVVFQGCPYEAWDYSATANKKTTDPLTSTERSNAAWKRVCLSLKDGVWVTSKATLVELGLVGSNTVSRMRKSLLGIIDQDLTEGADPLDLDWMEAERLCKGETPGDREIDFIDEDPMVRVWADRLTRGFGKEAWKAPITFFQAIHRYSPKLAEDLTEYLTESQEDF